MVNLVILAPLQSGCETGYRASGPQSPHVYGLWMGKADDAVIKTLCITMASDSCVFPEGKLPPG